MKIVSQTNTFRHNEYDVVDKFCDWLFTAENYNSTVIAHNQTGYDGRFILQWCLNKGLHPTQYILQRSTIMNMAFKKHRLRFVDSLHFFLEPLHKLSPTYNIDIKKKILSIFVQQTRKSKLCWRNAK